MKIIFTSILLLLFGMSCVNTPSEKKSKPTSIVTKKPKQLWATSYIWAKAPELHAEKWLSDKPVTKGKYVLIEHWNTWCPPCRRSIKLLNDLHRKYKNELVVIAITDEEPEAIKKMEKKFGIKLQCFSAVDTQKRQKEELGVIGVPHVIVLEPEGFVVWEGFPYQEGYELTEAKIEKILEVGRRLKRK